jgi:hypothetical protein
MCIDRVPAPEDVDYGRVFNLLERAKGMTGCSLKHRFCRQPLFDERRRESRGFFGEGECEGMIASSVTVMLKRVNWDLPESLRCLERIKEFWTGRPHFGED